MLLQMEMAQRIASGLQRKSVTSCSRWACAFRVMSSPFPGKWTFKYHPWLQEMHDSEAKVNIGQKAAQMGFTEWALNSIFYAIDIKKVDCLYLLPAKTPDASDFSHGRFDPALELSPHLQSMFSDVKNVGHKRAGTTNLYIRGSRSRSGLKSLPVGRIVLDELNEMMVENIPLALERVSGQVDWQALMLSTPTTPGAGIAKYYTDSTQEKFNFKCPSCSRWTELIFPECVEITGEIPTDPALINSYLKCKECQNKLHHELKPEWLSSGKWIPSFSNREDRGFQIPQMYSSAEAGKPVNIAKAYLNSFHDPANEQEFYNSKLGVDHAVSGAQLTDGDFIRCIGEYKKGLIPKSGLLTMGVDVGTKEIHYEIDQWFLGDVSGIDINTNANCKVIDMGKVTEFVQLDELMYRFGILFCVIDAHPERRSALQFANRFFGHVKLCIYGQGINGKTIHVTKDEEHMIIVDRTSWLDLALSRFRKDQAISIPMDTLLEYKLNLKALVRTYKKDKDGQEVGRYENGPDPDHFAHARNYAELALPFAAAVNNAQSIKSPI